MLNLVIGAHQLKAALTHSATRDVRYYLNGVLLERDTTGTYLVATDGHRMFVGKLDTAGSSDPLQVIIPTDTIKAALVSKVSSVTLARNAEGAWQLGAATFTPIDGRFPAWRAVVPTGGIDGRGEYPFTHLADAHKACTLWSHVKGRGAESRITRDNGTSCVVTGADGQAFCVIMGLNAKKLGAPTPAFM